MKTFFSVLLSFFLFIILFSPSLCSEEADVDNDGEVTTDDVMILLEMAAGKQTKNLSFDMNMDGLITSLDAYHVLEQLNITDPLVEELETVVQRYDVGDYFSDERMNWKITKTDGTKLPIGVIIRNGKIIEFKEGTVKDPSINAFTSEKTIRDLLGSENPKALREAWNDGSIQIDGVGIGNAVRLGFMGFANWITAPFT